MPRVILVAYDGAQGLDVFGPAEVFAGVERLTGKRAYEVVLASMGGRAIRTTSGIAIDSRDLRGLRPRRHDTVLVVGGEREGVVRAVRSKELVAWIARAARVVERIGSVCSGAFVLAAAGVLDGKRAATHWSSCDELAAFRPQVTVDRNAIYVNEGRVWTSAGVTTGIDMSLALVERDHGRPTADGVAARLVLYARRPGFQSQFSEVLVAQTQATDALGNAIAWARTNLRRRLDVPGLARNAGMSVRTLHRRCAEELDTTPAKLIERIRIEQARTLLATTELPQKTVAARCGFSSASRFAHAFSRTLGVPPGEYRRLTHREAAPGGKRTDRELALSIRGSLH